MILFDEQEARVALATFARHEALIHRLAMRGEPHSTDLIVFREAFLIDLDGLSLSRFRHRLTIWLAFWNGTVGT